MSKFNYFTINIMVAINPYSENINARIVANSIAKKHIW